MVWGKQAESCGEYLDKGSQIFVEGRLQTRDWEGKDGQKRSVTEVVAERVQFMGRTKGRRLRHLQPRPSRTKRQQRTTYPSERRLLTREASRDAEEE